MQHVSLADQELPQGEGGGAGGGAREHAPQRVEKPDELPDTLQLTSSCFLRDRSGRPIGPQGGNPTWTCPSPSAVSHPSVSMETRVTNVTDVLRYEHETCTKTEAKVKPRPPHPLSGHMTPPIGTHHTVNSPYPKDAEPIGRQQYKWVLLMGF